MCVDGYCPACQENYLWTLPIGQTKLDSYQIRKSDGKLFGGEPHEWLVKPLQNIIESPILAPIKFDVESREPYHKEVIVLNTLDNCYGHSLLYFLNLQNIINQRGERGVIVIIQPFLRWLLPAEGIAEIWTVGLSFNQLKEYHSDLSVQINEQFKRFDDVQLSHAPLCPKDVEIVKFSKIAPYSFQNRPLKPRVTFVWREDANRFWFKSYWFYGGLRKLGLGTILLPFHYARTLLFLYLLKGRLKRHNYQLTLAGLGKFGWFPDFIDDQRVTNFNKETEVSSCQIYAESELVVGVHGSSMILPSAHAAMTVSMMPPRRWGNFAEDLLYSEEDVRLAAFQKRVIPMKTTLSETIDIVAGMLTGRDYFIKKFIYDKTIL